MAKFLVLDCETAVHPDAQQWVEPVKVPGNYKKPESIEAYLKEATQERDERLALDPDCNRLVAIGFHVVGGADPTCFLMRDELEERQHLMQFRDLYLDLDRRNEVKVVSYFGHSFDLPVLMRRAMYLDVANFPQFNIDRYRTPHIDVYEKLSYRGALKAHGLAFYARRMGFTTLDKIDGAQIGQLVKEERWPEIEAHCLSDVGLCHSVAMRLGLLTMNGVAA